MGDSRTTTIVEKNNMSSSPIDSQLLAWAEYWYPIAWKGLLLAGIITAVGACFSIVFLLLQWRTINIRETQSEWRTSALELQTAEAKRDTSAAEERIATVNKETARLAGEAEVARAAIASANARAAEANAQALEAKLALDKFKAPRLLSREQFESIVENLPKVEMHTIVVLMTAYTVETVALSEQLVNLLSRAGYRAGSNRIIPPGALGHFSGIIVQYVTGNESSIRVGQAIAAGLNASGIDARAIGGLDESVYASKQFDRTGPNARNVTIKIGEKPR
ncbi:MAG: hypothetical protein ACLPKB_34440 [Xanthobacteraceae bacterium]